MIDNLNEVTDVLLVSSAVLAVIIFALFLSTMIAYGIIALTRIVWWTRSKVKDMTAKTVKFSDVPLPGIDPFNGPGASCTCEHACKIHHHMELESVRVNSTFKAVPRSRIPKVQAGIYSVDEKGKLVQYLGTVTRIDQWLLTAWHTVCDHETIAILSNAPEPIAHKFDVNKFEPIEGDLYGIRMEESMFSKLGLVKAKVASLDGPLVASITSSSKDPKISFGTLVHDAKLFGYVIYHGSTEGGFSGAPYMTGNQIAGLHSGGGQLNFGLSASYIQALLTKPEDTAEWLTKVKRKRGTLRYQRNKYNPDEAIVFVDGRFHTVDLKIVQGEIEVQGQGPYDQKVLYPDYEGEVNVSPSFPPQYKEEAEVVSTMINEAVAEVASKNLQMAEQECSATQAEEYMKMYNAMMERMNEATMLLQSLQNSVSDRYRENQLLVTQLKKSDEGRKVVVEEIEKLKKELTEIKSLKTFVNVEASSVKEIPKPVKRALRRKEALNLGNSIIEKIVAMGLDISDVGTAIEQYKASKMAAAEPVGNVEIIRATLTEAANMPKTTPSTSQVSRN
jgi:hypothetical protein